MPPAKICAERGAGSRLASGRCRNHAMKSSPRPPADPPSTAAEDLEESRRAQSYFEAIEEAFIRWRGAPFLLAPPDWQLVREWYHQGIPRSTVEAGLKDFFTRRAEERKDSKIWGLRQCRRAVESAWSRQQDLEAPVKSAAPDLGADTAQRLRALAQALPVTLRERGWEPRLRGLEGSPEEIEERLVELDGELLAEAESELETEQRRALEERLRAAVETLARRLPEQELARSRGALRQQLLREISGLPVLSLFSPAAEPLPAPDSSPAPDPSADPAPPETESS